MSNLLMAFRIIEAIHLNLPSQLDFFSSSFLFSIKPHIGTISYFLSRPEGSQGHGNDSQCSWGWGWEGGRVGLGKMPSVSPMDLEWMAFYKVEWERPGLKPELQNYTMLRLRTKKPGQRQQDRNGGQDFWKGGNKLGRFLKLWNNKRILNSGVSNLGLGWSRRYEHSGSVNTLRIASPCSGWYVLMS